jgi:GNAT superfamily N-acetyltransferase
MKYYIRLATLADKPLLTVLIEESVRGLSREDYSTKQIEAALATVFGVDTELINDGTYFVIETETDNKNATREIAACGGWSKKKTLFGGDQFSARESEELDPRTEAARIRAFFVHPDHARRGLGRMLLDHCEQAARAHGFTALELVGTLPGVKLYREYGFVAGEPIQHDAGGGVMIEFIPMRKKLTDDGGMKKEMNA